MRVMQIMAGAEFGGAETYFVDMVSALAKAGAKAGIDQKVVIRKNPQRAAELRRAGIEPVELPFGGLFDMVTRRRLARVIAEYKPDIVQSWMNRATRFVTRPRAASGFVHVGWFGGYYKVSNYTACDHLVGVTPDIRAHQVKGGWPDARAHYIPTFAHQVTASPVLRTEFDTPDDAPLFLALGRLHQKKAFDILIKAAAKVPGAYVWIAGEGELRGELMRLIGSEGVADRVRMLGWRDDRPALLAAADFCVMPSRYEPFGTVMIEAWSQDVPLIVAAAAGPKGLIEDSKTGLMVPIDDVDALAQAMQRLMDDPALCKNLVSNARAVFDERFTEAAIVAHYQKFYRDILQS